MLGLGAEERSWKSLGQDTTFLLVTGRTTRSLFVGDYDVANLDLPGQLSSDRHPYGAALPSRLRQGQRRGAACRNLLGSSVFAQGLMLDPTAEFGVKFGLTDAVELRVGP